MLEDPDLWVKAGIRLQDLFAGLAGGVVNVFASKRSDPWSILGSLVAGGLMANYLSDTFSQYLGGTKTGVAGFVIGVAGMSIAQGIIEASRSWRPFGSSSGKERGENAGPRS